MLRTSGLEGLESVEMIVSGDQHFGWLDPVIGYETYARPYFEGLKRIIQATRGKLVLVGDVFDETYCDDTKIAAEYRKDAKGVFALATEQQGKIPLILGDHEPDMDQDRLGQIIGSDALNFELINQHLYKDPDHPEILLSHGHQLIQPAILQALQKLNPNKVRDAEHLEEILIQDPNLASAFQQIRQTPAAMKHLSKLICKLDGWLKNNHRIRKFIEGKAGPAVERAHNIAAQSSIEIARLLGVTSIITGHTHLTGKTENMVNPGSISSHLSPPGLVVVGHNQTGQKVLRVLKLDAPRTQFKKIGTDTVVPNAKTPDPVSV